MSEGKVNMSGLNLNQLLVSYSKKLVNVGTEPYTAQNRNH